MNRRFALLFTAALGLLIVVPACDSSGVKLAPVSGTVTYKGKPLKAASIKFLSADGAMALGMTDENGTFKLTTNGRPGASIGNHKVAITKMTAGAVGEAAPASLKPEDMMKMQKSQMGKKDTGPKSEIPEIYGNPESSKLSADVSTNGSDNVFAYDLQ